MNWRKTSVKNTMWNKCCGSFIFFFSFSLLLLLLLLLFYSPTLTFRFWRTNAACVFVLFFSPAPNAEVQKLWRRSFRVAGAVTGAPVWAGGPLAFHAVGGGGRCVCLSSALESPAPPTLPNGAPCICFPVYRPGGDITPPVAKQSM